MTVSCARDGVWAVKGARPELLDLPVLEEKMNEGTVRGFPTVDSLTVRVGQLLFFERSPGQGTACKRGHGYWPEHSAVRLRGLRQGDSGLENENTIIK